MTGDQSLPIHSEDFLDRFLPFQRIGINHGETWETSDRQKVYREDDLFLRQPHDHRAVGMVASDIGQFEPGASKADHAGIADTAIRQDRIRIIERREALLDILMRNEGGPKRLEWLAAGDVIVMMMAVDHVLDRFIRDFLDLVDVSRNGLRTGKSDRIGHDYSIFRNDEHRLMIGVAVYVNV